MRAMIGALTVCDSSACLMSCSVSGCTSQKVSVRSKGVCATAQKFAYCRRPCASPPGSSGTMVKLICFDMTSVFSHYSDDDALELHLRGIKKHRLHRGVSGLEADSALFAIELLERDVRAADHRDDHFAVVGGLAVLDDDEVAVADLLVDHRIALDAQHVGVALADQVFRYGDGFCAGNRLNRRAGSHIAEEGQL